MASRRGWRPFPMGIIMLYFAAPITIIFLVVAAIDTDMLYGGLAFVFGALCIYFTADAAYHVGMRREATTHRLKKIWGDQNGENQGTRRKTHSYRHR